MRTISRNALVLIGLPVASAAVGLAMQHRHLVTSLKTALEERRYAQLEQSAKHVASKISTLDSETSNSFPAELSRGHDSLADAASTTVFLVDTNWKVANAHPEGAHDRSLTAQKQLTWKPIDDDAVSRVEQIHGTIDFSDGAQLAARQPIADRSGYVVACFPRARIEAEVRSLTVSLSSVGVIALVWTGIMTTVAVFVLMGRLHDRAESLREKSTAELMLQTQTLVRTRDAVIFGLAKLADSRHGETGEHLERIAAYATTLAEAARHHPKFAAEITPAFVRLIGISSALHDIGKVGVEDGVLLKRGALTADERTRMETHTRIGSDCLREIEQRLGSSNFLQMAREVALHHHERWDGKGYPERLAGDAIPLAARIVAIADVYDALRTPRVYKSAVPHEECVAAIRAESGTQFDAQLIEVWFGVEERFREIADRYDARISRSSPNVAEDRPARGSRTSTASEPRSVEPAPLEDMVPVEPVLMGRAFASNDKA